MLCGAKHSRLSEDCDWISRSGLEQTNNGMSLKYNQDSSTPCIVSIPLTPVRDFE
jgi:hypothetical protein